MDVGTEMLGEATGGWQYLQTEVHMLTWIAISMSIIIGDLGLLYAYNQQVPAFEAVRLAEWTALKDFRELRQERAVC